MAAPGSAGGFAPDVIDGLSRYLDQYEAGEQPGTAPSEVDAHPGQAPPPAPAAPESESATLRSALDREQETPETPEQEGVEEGAEPQETEEEVSEAAGAEDEDAGGINTLADLAVAFSTEDSPITVEELLDHLTIENAEGELVPLSVAKAALDNAPVHDEAVRAEVETVTAEFRQAHDEHTQELVNVTAQLVSRVTRSSATYTPQVLDQLKAQDPSKYIQVRDFIDQEQADAQAALSALEEDSAKRAADDEKRQAIAAKGEMASLYRKMPQWRDPKVGTVAQTDIRKYMTSAGYSQEDQGAMVDHRDMITAWKAAQWDKRQERKPEVLKKIRALPQKGRAPVTPAARGEEPAPGTAEQKARATALDKFRQSGSIEGGNHELFERHIR